MRRKKMGVTGRGGMEPLFVYGTLMTGRHNNDRLMRLGCTPADPEALAPGVDIYHVSGALFPAAVHGEGTAVGEVWWIPKRSIPELDRFEACYRRERVLVSGSRRSFSAWVYIWDRSLGGLGARVDPFERWQPEREWLRSSHYTRF